MLIHKKGVNRRVYQEAEHKQAVHRNTHNTQNVNYDTYYIHTVRNVRKSTGERARKVNDHREIKLSKSRQNQKLDPKNKAQNTQYDYPENLNLAKNRKVVPKGRKTRYFWRRQKCTTYLDGGEEIRG